MNFQQLIDKRRLLTEEQQLALEDILLYKQRGETRIKLKEKLRNKLFSIFDETGMAKQFNIVDNSVVFVPVVLANRDKELKAIRDRILLFTV